MAGLTDAERGLLRAALRRAGNSGITTKAGQLPGPDSIPALVGQLAAAQQEICAVIRVAERLDRRIVTLEDQLAGRPRPAGMTAVQRGYVRSLGRRVDDLQHQIDAQGTGPVPYVLTPAAEAYLAATADPDELTNGVNMQFSKACSAIIIRDARV